MTSVQQTQRTRQTTSGETGILDALAYSEAWSSLAGYCSLNSRSNFCASATCSSDGEPSRRKCDLASTGKSPCAHNS